MRISVLHPGTQYAIRVAEELSKNGLLYEFWTGIGLTKSSIKYRFIESLLPRLAKAFENRVSKTLRNDEIKCVPIPELSLLIKQYRRRVKPSHFLERNRVFQEKIPERVIKNSSGILGYDTSSWIVAQRCVEAGRPFILDQSIGHSKAKERIFERLRNRYPAWQSSILRGLDEMYANEAVEHELAKVIVSPSQFVAETLIAEGIDPSKIVIIPFGTDTTFFAPPAQARSVERLRFLFVGGLTARKGVPDLLEAWQLANLKNAELWIAGSGDIPPSVLKSLPPSIQFLGKLSRYEVAERMRNANAFFFPSHFEGLAQVQVEALSCSLPVIATHESGASDLIIAEQTGCIIQAGNIDEILQTLRKLDRNRDLLSEWEKNLGNNPGNLSWDTYGRRWINEVLPRIGNTCLWKPPLCQ